MQQSHQSLPYGILLEILSGIIIPLHYDFCVYICSSSYFTPRAAGNTTLRDLKLKAIKPLVFDAYYISMLSEQKSKHSSIFGIVRGFTSNSKAKKSGEYSSLTYYLFK